MRYFRTGILGLAALGMGVVASEAATSVYTDDSAFNTAVNAPLTLETFNGLTHADDLGNLVVSPEVKIEGLGDTFDIVNSYFCGTSDTECVHIRTDHGGTSIKFSFNPDINSFGISATNLGIDLFIFAFGTTLTVETVEGVETIYTDYFDFGTSFVGIITDSMISSVTLTNSLWTDDVWFDDLRYGVSSSINGEIPLPAGLPLLGSALGVFGLYNWRRKRQPAS